MWLHDIYWFDSGRSPWLSLPQMWRCCGAAAKLLVQPFTAELLGAGADGMEGNPCPRASGVPVLFLTEKE